ncbi:MAG TPA: 4Fe-4S ferredoxin [Clostridiales bacterium]|nr:4Fe-4S ferredoxin [Clostridiales bacterium]
MTGPGPGFIVVHILGKAYRVPEGLTILRAMEHAGYRLVRGVGCRGGFCGACGTLYRTRNDYRIKVGLACQTVAEHDMYLAQLPFYPASKARYALDQLGPSLATLVKLHPELPRCLGCNTCTRTCPQGLDVMEYMARAMRGDLAGVADLSFDCIMCGLCASRCPAEQTQYNVALLARRLYGRHLAPKAAHLSRRVGEVAAGQFDAELDRMSGLDAKALKVLYDARDIEA